MARRHFSEYPYINFSDFNYDWIIKRIKDLSKEWLSYKENMEVWVNDTDSAIKELTDYIQTFFKFQVDEYVEKLFREGYFDQVIARAILNRTEINTRLVGSFFNVYSDGSPAAPNGACYIGDNKMVQYLSTNASSVGKVQVIDMNSWQIISETELELKHGNSLTYNPENKKLYSVALFNNNASDVLLNEVMVVNFDNYLSPYVEETVALPMPAGSTGVYSLSYDVVSKTFAGTIKTSPTGSIIAGQSNRIVIYNKELTEIIREVILEGDLLINNQGIQCFYDNKAYINYCDYNYYNIGVYDAVEGTCISMIDLPKFIDGYRFIGEPEAFIFNWDNERWYCSSAYTGSGVSGSIGLSIFEMGIYRNIPNVKLTAQSYNLYNTRRLGITLKNGDSGVSQTPYTMYCLMDAINLCVNNNLQGRITVEENHTDIGSVDIIGFVGDIYGKNSYHAKFTGAVRIFNSRVRITFSDFTGSFTEDGRTCSIFVNNSYLSMEGSSFSPQLLAYDDQVTWRNNTGDATFIRSLVQSPTQPSGTFTQSTYLPYT